MKSPTKAERRDAAIREHYRREVEMFALKPWETLPLFVEARDPPAASDTGLLAESWRRAKAWRAELLKANPRHYADIE